MHTLETRLTNLRHRLRRLLWFYGLGGAAAAVGATLLLLGLIDYRLRFDDLGLRLMASLAMWGVAAWSVYRFLYRPLAAHLADADLARRVERLFPGLHDRLRSAVEFAAQAENDPLAGSPALRRAVIAEATAETDNLDFSGVLDPRPARRAVLLGAAVALLAASFVLLDPLASRIAVGRLVNPFGAAAWPRQTQLVLKHEVTRIARGQPFEVEVVAAEGTALPDEARAHYRFENADGSVAVETDLLRSIGGTIVARREHVQRSFAFRIEAGDDRSMPWHEVEVVAPAEIVSLAVWLKPPDYTGWPDEKTDGPVRALIGTRAVISAAVSKPLRSAMVRWGDDRAAPAALSEDGLRLTAPAAGELLVEAPGTYWLELVDTEGVEGGEEHRFEIRAVPDAAPSIAFESPATNLFVTPQAVVPLRLTAKDDLALAEVSIVFSRSDQGETETPQRVVLWRGQRPEGRASSADAAGQGDHVVVEHRFELSPLVLSPGVEISLVAEASDFKPQAARSEPRRLTLITPEQLQERLAARQAEILAELERVLQMQRDARRQVDAVAVRVQQLGAVEQADVDRMQAAELRQRQVDRALTSRRDGVAMHVVAMLDDLANNRLDSPDVQRRMEAILAEIERLGRERLPLVGSALVAAVKAAQVRLASSLPAAGDGGTIEALAAALGHQQAVIDSLEAMLAELRQWDSYRRFHRELSQLLREHHSLERRTAETARATLTRSLGELTPQQRADLRVLGGQQLELARRLDRLLGEMQQAADELRSTDPIAADLVADAFDEGRRLATGAKMRAAGRDIQENQIGRAMPRQQEIARDIEELLDILANRRQQELDRLVRKLAQAEGDLVQLEEQQARLAERLADEARAPHPGELQRLADEQQRLEDQTQRLGRRLERLMAERAARTAGQAAAQMAGAARSAAGGDASGAQRQADDARGKLAEARRQLAAQRQQAQAELAVEQLEKLADAVKHLRTQQQGAIDETLRLEDLRARQGQLTRAQAMSQSDLAKLQRSLQTDAVAMGDKLLGAGAFQLALAAAAREMGQAAARLERRLTDAAVVEAQRRSLGRLDLLLEALAPEPPPDNGQDANNGGAGDGPGNQAGGGVHTLAELKMLKLLQVEINARTAESHQLIGESQPTAEQQRELAALADEQSRLSELVLQMLVPREDDALPPLGGEEP